MNKRNNHTRPIQDFVSEEMVIALLQRASYDFNELFVTIHTALRARGAIGGGQEMLRLRVYEKLHILVAQGLVKKDGKQYSGVRNVLQIRQAEMAAAAARRELRRSQVLHTD